LWLSGTDKDCEGNYQWCSIGRKFVNKEMKWKSGHPIAELDCVYLESGTQLLASANCSEQKNFLCEVKKEGTSRKAMQQECAEIWKITEGCSSSSFY